MLEKPETETWTAKGLYVVAFLVTGLSTYFLISMLHDSASATYPVLGNPLLGILIGSGLAVPVFFAEDRLLLRLTGRGLTNNPRTSSIRPVSMGIFVGSVLPYVLSSQL